MRRTAEQRTWAFALVFLAFFFILPIGLALAHGGCSQLHGTMKYNDYGRTFIQDAAMTDLQYKTRLLELKTEVVLSGVEYGNGMIAFLMITAAVVIGVSSFAYLHNKKKVDFTTASRWRGGPVCRPVLRRHIYSWSRLAG
ncbi:MAG: hypothetical protein ACLRZZ_23855 [Enterocloster sp.]